MALGLSVTSLADAACGVIWLRIQAPAGQLDAQLPSLLQEWRAQRTQIVVAAASPGRRAQLDLWGPHHSALSVMQRLKRHFDPDGMLNAGRDLVSASLIAASGDGSRGSLCAERQVSHVG